MDSMYRFSQSISQLLLLRKIGPLQKRYRIERTTNILEVGVTKYIHSKKEKKERARSTGNENMFWGLLALPRFDT